MKKVFLKFIIVFNMIFILKNQAFAFSNEFQFLIETMGISSQNEKGLEINEEVYKQYNLFVYGGPLDNHIGQRWKNVSTGLWTQNGGPWTGNGVRGEYWILGINSYGKLVHNHLFPVDIEPPTPPTAWRYVFLPDAMESWQNAEKYMDSVQREYMLSQKLTRNNITYDLTVMDIGLDKVRLENYATWKSNGSVYTQRYDKDNKKWAANFLIPPMAGDAELEGYAIFENGMIYELNENSESLDIPIKYGADVLNLTDYAKAEHVNTIKSQLYINGNFIEEISDTETLSVQKDTLFKVNKNEYPNQKEITLKIEIKSSLLTKFTTDGALIDIKEYELIIWLNEIEEEIEDKTIYNSVYDEHYKKYPKIPAPKITEIEVKKLTNGREEDLYIAKNTGEKFICAGETLIFRVKIKNNPDVMEMEIEGDTSISTFDDLTKRFEWIEPRERNTPTLFKSLKEYENLYNSRLFMEEIESVGEEKIFEITYIIPYRTKQTLHSWETLRKVSNNAFEINTWKLFTRITRPYEFVFKARDVTGSDTKRIKIDVFERWDTLYNRNIYNYIKN